MNDTVRLQLNPDADSRVTEPGTAGEVPQNGDVVGKLELSQEPVGAQGRELADARAEIDRLRQELVDLAFENADLRRVLAQGRD